MKILYGSYIYSRFKTKPLKISIFLNVKKIIFFFKILPLFRSDPFYTSRLIFFWKLKPWKIAFYSIYIWKKIVMYHNPPWDISSCATGFANGSFYRVSLNCVLIRFYSCITYIVWYDHFVLIINLIIEFEFAFYFNFHFFSFVYIWCVFTLSWNLPYLLLTLFFFSVSCNFYYRLYHII